MKTVIPVLLLCGPLTMTVAATDMRTYNIAEVLALPSAPAGVVFDIVSNDDDALESALPEVNKYLAKLRDRFPSLRVAVVSHGLESLALMRQYAEAYPTAHLAARELGSTAGVTLHVCGRFAKAHGASAGGFLPFVDVSSGGEAQIERYRAQGYLQVELDMFSMTGDPRSCPLPDNYRL